MRLEHTAMHNTFHVAEAGIQLLSVPERLRRSAELYGSKTAFVSAKHGVHPAYSFAETHARASAIGAMLMEAGLKKGDRVGCLLMKNPDAMLCFLGALTAGTVFFPIDHNLPAGLLNTLLENTRPKALFVAKPYLPLLQGLDNIPYPERIFVLDTPDAAPPAGCRSFRDHESLLGRHHDFPEILPDDPAYLNLTSGTTGVPKTALTTHGNIDANSMASVEVFRFTADDVHLCMFPAFVHPHELFARPVYLGGTTVLLDTVQPKSVAQALHDFKVTTFMAVASIYETLIRLNNLDSLDFSHLRVPESGGMHVTPTLRETFAQRFGVPIQAVWGSTEATGIALANRAIDDDPRVLEAPPGSAGRSCPLYEARIMHGECQEAGVDEIGELWIRGPGVCKEYFIAPGKTIPVVDNDGWFRTNDLMRKDKDGFFHFMARSSGMMKVGGIKVFPTEIENVLRAHPSIDEIVVIKVDDTLHGEVPKAFIVTKPGMPLNQMDIRRYCEGRLHRYKVPRLIEFVDQLPKTPGGKVAWKKLSSVC